MGIPVIAAAVVLILAVLILIAAGNFLYTVAITPGGFAKLARLRRKPDNSSSEDTSPEPERDEYEEWWNTMPTEAMQIASHDSIILKGYYIENAKPSNRLAVLIHGYSGKASEMAVYAKIYYEMGFDIFAPDNRGHGESGGKAIGMGWLDRLDYLRWLELLNARNGGKTEILIHGHSMGGAAASVLAGEDLPQNVKGIISDCAYDSVKNVLTWQLKSIFRLPPFPMVPMTSVICRIRAGYYFGEGDVASHVARTKIPIMFIHGNQDTFVPFSMADSLYNAVDPSLREIWLVDGAKHAASIRTDAEGYASRIKAFIERTFSSN